MRIQYCSDLHLEFEQNCRCLEEFPLKVSGEVLILAGDIIPLHNEYLTNSILQKISENYKQVFWVPGNHEFYYKDISLFEPSFEINVFNNISIVNNVLKDYKGIRFIFSTLWSKIRKSNEKTVENGVADFACISVGNNNLKSFDFNQLHETSLRFLEKTLVEKKKKTVVVTHHLPSVRCNALIHRNSPINDAFCVDLTDFIETCDANFWIYGHSHFNQKPIYIGNTILLTNQLGYVQLNENGTFKPDAYFAI